MNGQTGFLYLNLENRWPLIRLQGLVIDPQGSLALARVPGADPPVSLDLGLPVGAAGVAAGGDGSLFLSDPDDNRVLKIHPDFPERILYLGEMGSLPGQFRTPRGLTAGWPEALYVTDSGNHRIQVFDQHTLQLRGVWGQPDPYADPQPGSKDGRFNDPWDVAIDSACNLYVVDHGNRRLQKLDWMGRPMPEFWARVSSGITLGEPTHLAIRKGHAAPASASLPRSSTTEEVEDRLYVVDRARREVLVFSPDGDFLDAWGADVLGEPAGIVVIGEAVYVGDNQRRTVLKFLAVDGQFVGEARGYEGPVAGLGVDARGNLVIHPGLSSQTTRLVPDAAFVPLGSFLAGPLEAETFTTLWHRLRVEPGSLPEDTHLQLFVHTGDSSAEPPFDVDQENPFPSPAWQPAPRDVLDALIPSPAGSASGAAPGNPLFGEPARFLWVGGLVQSAGTHSPSLRQIRVDFGRDTYLRYLPAIYAQKAEGRDFLERFLSLFESTLGGLEETISDHLPQVFDSWAAPQRFLPWLAGWLAFDLDEDWSDEQKRQRIAGAFRLQSLRGTVEGMRGYLKLYAGVEASIEEPALQTSLWALGEESVLGFNTMLAPAYPDGAVLGVSATLDQSNLSEAEDYGASLFEATAFRFCVQVQRSELARLTAQDEVRAVIEREMPAHTEYHLCVIEPRMRVGFQARLGIDTIVADRPPELLLDGQAQWGFARLAPEMESKRQAGGSLGKDARLGNKTTLI